MAALASRAKTNWPMRSFSSGWIDRTASSHSARLGSQVPQEKAQRTPSIAGTEQHRRAGETMHEERSPPPPPAQVASTQAWPRPFRPGVRAKGAGRRPTCARSPTHLELTLFSRPRRGLQERAARGGDAGPPLRSAAARDVTWGGASGSVGRDQGQELLVAPLTLGEALTGQRLRPIAVRPVAAARLGWRFRRLQLQVGELWGLREEWDGRSSSRGPRGGGHPRGSSRPCRPSVCAAGRAAGLRGGEGAPRCPRHLARCPGPAAGGGLRPCAPSRAAPPTPRRGGRGGPALLSRASAPSWSPRGLPRREAEGQMGACACAPAPGGLGDAPASVLVMRARCGHRPGGKLASADERPSPTLR